MIEPRKKHEKFVAYVPPKETFIKSPNITIGAREEKSSTIEGIIENDLVAKEGLKKEDIAPVPTFSTLETEKKKEAAPAMLYNEERIEGLLRRLKN